MKYDMIVVAMETKEGKVWNQPQGWTATIN